MKRGEIVVGGTYTDGLWNRRITGDADSRSSRQKDDEQVQYVEIYDEQTIIGGPYTCTRRAFARWAQRRIDTPATPADAEARG